MFRKVNTGLRKTFVQKYSILSNADLPCHKAAPLPSFSLEQPPTPTKCWSRALIIHTSVGGLLTSSRQLEHRFWPVELRKCLRRQPKQKTCPQGVSLIEGIQSVKISTRSLPLQDTYENGLQQGSKHIPQFNSFSTSPKAFLRPEIDIEPTCDKSELEDPLAFKINWASRG